MKGLYAEHSVTWSLVWATLVSGMSTLQFGYHLAVFNAPQEILTCQKSVAGPLNSYLESLWGKLDLPQCIPMSPASVASINAMFTVGGLVSSIIVGSHVITGAYGRKFVQKVTAILFCVGSAIIALSPNALFIEVGRLVTGLAAGACMVMAPILISELSPINHKGLMGSLLQFGVGIGILVAQGLSFPWSNDQQWRNMFLAGAFIGLVQCVLLFTTVESPQWLIMQKGDISNASDILYSMRTNQSATRREIKYWRRMSLSAEALKKQFTENSTLLDSLNEASAENAVEYVPETLSNILSAGSTNSEIVPIPVSLSLADYLFSPKYRKEWFAVVITMSAQQLCGMNAITFYGVSVMSKVVPKSTNVLYLTLSLALTNVISALAVCPFIDRWGRRTFLLVSVGTMAVFSSMISTGLIRNQDYLAVVGCFGFVVAYSIGLGQIPFLMINELSSIEAISIAQSLGTTCNWMANICVAVMFPLLRGVFGDLVFLVFLALGLFFFVGIYFYVPETRKKTNYSDVWFGFE